jgi:hypothetical protein
VAVTHDEGKQMKEAEVIETQAMTVTNQNVAVVDVTDASREGLALMRERVDNQKQMLKIALSLTAPGQWTVFGDSVYPTGGAADTILRRAFGLTWGPKEITVEETPQGPVAVCRAWLMQGGRTIEQFEGRRSMGGFIDSESDMRKGAVENMKSVAVRDLLGLRFRSAEELQELGLNVGKLQRRVEFNEGRGGGRDAPSGDGGDIVPFGKNKGTPIGKLDDKQLAWYIGAAEKAVADPTKEKWRAKEQRWLDALLGEQSRRKPTEWDNVGGPPLEDREPGADG